MGKITKQVKADLVQLIRDIIKNENWADFAPGGECHDPTDGDEPSALQLTVGTDDGSRWGYQTGDNSYTGGAYGSRHWAVVSVGQDSDPADVVAEIVGQWEELMSENEEESHAGHGYVDCACRDCFDVAICHEGSHLCHDCETAGCDGTGESECNRDPDAPEEV